MVNMTIDILLSCLCELKHTFIQLPHLALLQDKGW